MKCLTALLLLFSLVLPAGLMTQAKAAPVQTFCAVVDDSGSACCQPAAIRCCCKVSPGEPATPVQPVPLPTSASAKEAAAPLPTLLILGELPRLADLPAKSAFLHRGAPPATAPSVRLCVLRCSLLL